MDIHELSTRARQLADDLFSGGPRCSCRGLGGCLDREEKRPLTRAEKQLGWSRRSFDAYDPQQMCLACAAYWHAESAAQALHNLACIVTRTRAAAEACEEEAKGGMSVAPEGLT